MNITEEEARNLKENLEYAIKNHMIRSFWGGVIISSLIWMSIIFFSWFFR
jgi:hypothetical protein